MGTDSFIRRRLIEDFSRRTSQSFAESKQLLDKCAQHSRRDWPTKVISCPCVNRLDWLIARYDEAIYLLQNGCPLIRWCWWYFRTSAKNPFFPRDGLNTYGTQPASFEPIANRYNIAIIGYDHVIQEYLGRYHDGKVRHRAKLSDGYGR